MAWKTSTLWYQAASNVMWRERSNATPYRVFARFDGNVEVPLIPGEEAPVALVVHRRTGDIAWRLHDGALWRPILHPTEAPMPLDVAGLSAIMTDGARFRAAVGSNTWRDNPFCNAPRGAGYDLATDPTGYRRRDEMVDSKVAEDTIDRARQGVLRAAGNDIVEIDGIVHRRALPPLWGAALGHMLPYHRGDVAIVVPELHPTAQALFGIDGREAALALSDRVRERVLGMVGDWLPAHYAELANSVEDATHEQTMGIPDVDPVSLGLGNAADRLEDELQPATMKMMSFELLGAYVDFLRAARRPDGVPDLVGAASAGRALGDLMPRNLDWPLASSALSIGLVEALRIEEVLRLDLGDLDHLDVNAGAPFTP